MKRFLVGAILSMLCTILFGSFATPATAANGVDETQKSAAAVSAVDDHWTRAEVHGDVAWLDGMLLPQYRSIGANGVASPKSKILASAKKNATSDKMARLVAKYMKEHPSGRNITIEGDTAIVNFYAPKIGAQRGVMSCDVFIYKSGRWHALYSQHTTVKG
ncbi:MAG: nuclear transport factor 2 family protein [Candidatus Eremiobacteraeota bacterium]|nr:nuclear transport factor 2 family protein [Candidatus Eremiobacteraeota bacterium]